LAWIVSAEMVDNNDEITRPQKRKGKKELRKIMKEKMETRKVMFSAIAKIANTFAAKDNYKYFNKRLI